MIKKLLKYGGIGFIGSISIIIFLITMYLLSMALGSFLMWDLGLFFFSLKNLLDFPLMNYLRLIILGSIIGFIIGVFKNE